LLLELYIDTPSSLLVTALFTIILSLELLRATPYLLLLRVGFAIVLLLLEYTMCIPQPTILATNTLTMKLPFDSTIFNLDSLLLLTITSSGVIKLS